MILSIAILVLFVITVFLMEKAFDILLDILVKVNHSQDEEL